MPISQLWKEEKQEEEPQVSVSELHNINALDD